MSITANSGARIGALKANDLAESRPVDVDQLIARLHQLSDSRDTSPQALSGPSRHERAATEECDWDAEDIKFEAFAYNDLLREGGQPAYPIVLLEEISKHPEKYCDLLRPWQEYPDRSPPDWEEIFGTQLKRWRDFRKWQVDNRGLQDDGREYLEFVERGKLSMERQGLTWLKMLPRSTSTESDHEKENKSTWKDNQAKRQDDWYWLREDHGRGEFPGYIEEVKRRLTKHGFTRMFQLDEDPQRQDKLTTWIEYLNYEYSWHDRYTRLFKRQQPKYDEAWKKLVDSGVLRPGETDESLRTTESSYRQLKERDQARDAVKFAKAAAHAALEESAKGKDGRPRLTAEERKRRLAATRENLALAKQALKAAEERWNLIGEFITVTGSWFKEKNRIYSHNFLLQWILEQVHDIEAESNEPDQDEKVAENKRPARPKRRGQLSSVGADTPIRQREPSKRSRPDETVCGGRSSKRLKTEGRKAASHDVSSVGDSQTSEIPAAVKKRDVPDLAAKQTGKVRRSGPGPSTDMPQSPASAPQLRRSPRIAAFSKTTRTSAQSDGPPITKPVQKKRAIRSR